MGQQHRANELKITQKINRFYKYITFSKALMQICNIIFKYRVFAPMGSNFNTQKTCGKCCINNERPTGQKQQLLDGRTVKNKGKLILNAI